MKMAECGGAASLFSALDSLHQEVDYLADIEKRLEGALGRRVKIQSKKNKGKIELEYYGNDDLDRLVTALAAVIL